MRSARQTVTLTTIAETSDRFRDFSPYVAAINDAGTVAFQATLLDGTTGIFTGSGGVVASRLESTGDVASRFYSHPDINNEGALCVYGVLAGGHERVLLAHEGGVIAFADTSGPFLSICPLGPTMNHRGAVAFRANTRAQRSGVFTRLPDGSLVTVADTGRFAGFQGLPVITDDGSVVFRADLPKGGHGIYRSRGQDLEAVAMTGDRFHTLGFFPSANVHDTVVFCATLRSGDAGIFRAKDGNISTIAGTNDGFESFRGALINDSGTVFFYATPRGGRLGIYAGPDPVRDAVLSIGDPLFGSTVVDFALNPVSINERGQLAIRVRLASSMQWIVRVESPASAASAMG